MIKLKKALHSTIGKKYLMSLTGLSLLLFVVVHLLGNLPLLYPNPKLYNKYSNALINLGIWLNVAETILLILSAVHVILAICLRNLARQARPIYYLQTQSKMGPSKMNFSSRNLVISGTAILLFLAVHVFQFRFGPGVGEGYAAKIDHEVVRDVHRVVVEAFHNPWIVGFYLGSMIFLALHLKHGFWSAFQSLGLTTRSTSDFIYKSGVLFAIFLSLGFSFICIALYLDLPNRFFGEGL